MFQTVPVCCDLLFYLRAILVCHFFITQMVSLLIQSSVYRTEELRRQGRCSYRSGGSIKPLLCPYSQNQQGHVNNSKHVLMCELARKKFRLLNVHETYYLINCLQVGAIIWYCVFIWMEHACRLGVKENLFTSTLFLNVIKKKMIHFVLFLMGSTRALTWNTNK